MASELDCLFLLVRLTLASSAAVLVLLLLRPRLRAAFGANLAYQAWLLVPLAMLAAALPPTRLASSPVQVLLPGPSVRALGVAGTQLVAPVWPQLLLPIWFCGALCAMLAMLWSQRRYERALGSLRVAGDVRIAAHARGGPALLGLFAPVIVVPADFTTRYSAAERALILAHERRHASRGDPYANIAAALMQCVFWFNPLIHVAAGRFRFDQELACDADVLAAHPGQAKAYASAMLKTQLAGAPALATCHWQSSHPLKERIMQLQQARPPATRRRAGRLLLAALATACVGLALSARAQDAPTAVPVFDVALVITAADGTSPGLAPVRLRAGEHHRVRSLNDGVLVQSDFVFYPAGADTVGVGIEIVKGGRMVGKPRMVARYGETARLRVGGSGPRAELEIEVTVKKVEAPN